jgi:hypothetical protein
MDSFETDPGQIARRLGVTEELVRRLQARGVLRSFDLGETEVRLRLCEGHLRRLVVPVTSRTPGETAKPKKAKPAKSPRQRPIAPRPKPPLEP